MTAFLIVDAAQLAVEAARTFLVKLKTVLSDLKTEQVTHPSQNPQRNAPRRKQDDFISQSKGGTWPTTPAFINP